MNVGVRELRDGLSRHLANVRGGSEITVTDHGKPIARLVPVDAESGLEQLIAPAVLQAVRARADETGRSLGGVLTELVEVGVEYAAEPQRRRRSGLPVVSGSADHVITDDLVAEYLDEQ